MTDPRKGLTEALARIKASVAADFESTYQELHRLAGGEAPASALLQCQIAQYATQGQRQCEVLAQEWGSTEMARLAPQHARNARRSLRYARQYARDWRLLREGPHPRPEAAQSLAQSSRPTPDLIPGGTSLVGPPFQNPEDRLASLALPRGSDRNAEVRTRVEANAQGLIALVRLELDELAGGKSPAPVVLLTQLAEDIRVIECLAALFKPGDALVPLGPTVTALLTEARARAERWQGRRVASPPLPARASYRHIAGRAAREGRVEECLSLLAALEAAERSEAKPNVALVRRLAVARRPLENRARWARSKS